MQEQENVDLIKKVYEAFGKGDIDTIIGFSRRSFDSSCLSWFLQQERVGRL
jgi:hypothetical protein